jgi:AraC-like DNA-binding protein
MVLQGAKQMTIANEVREFSAGQSVVVGLDIPVTGRVVSATPERPYIALAVELDMAVVRELATQLDVRSQPRPASIPKFFVEDTEAAALDCGMRLMRLVDRPDAVPVLQPGILKELHYWLLSGKHSATIRRLALPGGFAQRIAAAVKLLRAQFDKPLRVEALAASADMSVSTFHRHFKAMTSLSPVQFQKQLRLIEARRRMLSEGCAASRAAFDVGYESVSQFTREYSRLFGAPPRRDIRRRGNRPIEDLHV